MSDHLQAIERAVQTVLYPDELYEQFLFHLTAATTAHGAAIWHLDAHGQARRAASYGASDEHGRDAWEEHRHFVGAALASSPTGQAITAPGDPGNPTALSLLIQKVHQRCPLVIEVAQRATAPPASLREYAEFLERMAGRLSCAKCIPWE